MAVLARLPSFLQTQTQTPKPSERSPAPQEPPLTETQKVKIIFHECFARLWESGMKAEPHSMQLHYYDGLHRSRLKFQAFLKAKDDFNVGLKLRYRPVTLDQLYIDLIKAHSDIAQEIKEMDARLHQDKAYDPRMAFREALNQAEMRRVRQMIRTDLLSPIFLQSLSELLVKLQSIQWVTSSDRDLYMMYGWNPPI
jgi:hypothetical protein